MTMSAELHSAHFTQYHLHRLQRKTVVCVFVCMTPLQVLVLLCKRSRRVFKTALPWCLHCIADRHSDRKRRCVFVQLCVEVGSVVMTAVLCISLQAQIQLMKNSCVLGGLCVRFSF